MMNIGRFNIDLKLLRTSFVIFLVISAAILTVYLSENLFLRILKRSFHFSDPEVKLFLRVAVSLLLIATLFYASLFNYYDKKKMMLFSAFFLFLSFVVLIIAPSNFYIFIFASVIQSIFLPGIIAVMLAYVQEIYPERYRGLGIGIYMAATSFGIFLGNLSVYLVPWRLASMLCAIILSVMFFIIFFGLPVSEKEDIKTKNRVKKRNLISYLLSAKIMSVLIITTTVYSASIIFLTGHTYSLHKAPMSFSGDQIKIILLSSLIGVFISPVVGWYSKSMGSVNSIYVGLLSLVIGILFTLTHLYALVIVGVILVHIGIFSVFVSSVVYLGDLVPNDKSRIVVLYQAFVYLQAAIFIGSLIPPDIPYTMYTKMYDKLMLLSLESIIYSAVPLFYIHYLKKYNRLK